MKLSYQLLSSSSIVSILLSTCQGFHPLVVPSSTQTRGRLAAPPLLMSTLSPTSDTKTRQEGENDDHMDDTNKKPKVKQFKVVRSNNSQQEETENENEKTIPKLPYGPLSMTIDELAEQLGGRGRARLVWDCYSIGIDPAHFYGDTITNLGYDDFESIYDLLPSSRRSQRVGPAALQKLAALFPQGQGCVEGSLVRLSHVSQSRDLTTKLLLQLHDGLQVETVIIPWNGVRSTLCISSQVGCRMACKFCATGKMNLQRSLTSDEILAQMFFARKMCRWYQLPPVTNVVFMGMGEPSDNAAQVVRATEILTTRSLFQLSATKVMVSTVAPTPAAFHHFAQAPCVLAWSVHAARDEVRRELVPTTCFSMLELRQGLIDSLLQRPMNFRTTMLEVVLIDQVNDNPELDGGALVELSQAIVSAVPGCKLVVNLIPYNDIGPSTKGIASPSALRTYRTPSKESIRVFQKYLWDNGVHAHVRVQRGDDESAACGQLATKHKNSAVPTRNPPLP